MRNIIKAIKTPSKYLFCVSIFLVCIVYFIAHFATIQSLPIFADEAIYVRWTQLMIDDWNQYAFFSLNDGKTPLLYWLLIPTQLLPFDNVISARLFSVLVGFLQIIAMGWVAYVFSARRLGIVLSMALTAFLPFWFFHHNFVLLDGFLTLWLTLFLGVTQLLFTHISRRLDSKTDTLKYNPGESVKRFGKNIFLLIWDARFLILLNGSIFGLALLTKLPAILAVPAFFILVFYFPFNEHRSSKPNHTNLPIHHIIIRSLALVISIAIGISIFAVLFFHPAFPQLFSRGGDFLFPVSDILFGGAWKDTIPNIPNYIYTFFTYLTPPVSFIIIASLFYKYGKARAHTLFWMGIFFLLPIMILGRVVYPRYLFPASLFFTLSAALTIETMAFKIKEQTVSILGFVTALALALLVSNTVSISASYIYIYATNPNELPLTSADAGQYLYEWSAGYGIKETSALLLEMAKDGNVIAATEGSFGTLPDGIMAYLHNKDLTNVFLDGIGYPLSIDKLDKFIEKQLDARTDPISNLSTTTWLFIANENRVSDSNIASLVNSNELQSDFVLLESYCRPHNAPCMNVWDITHYVAHFNYYSDQ